MDLASGVHLGPYEIVSRLGSRGMGEVFEARDTRLGRAVAIKVLSRQFADDVRLRLRLYPNICTLYDIGEDGGKTYLVMELLMTRLLPSVSSEARFRSATYFATERRSPMHWRPRIARRLFTAI